MRANQVVKVIGKAHQGFFILLETYLPDCITPFFAGLMDAVDSQEAGDAFFPI